MKTKKVLLTILIAIVVIIMLRNVSCSRDDGSSEIEIVQDKSLKLTPYDTTVKGYLSDVLEVVDDTYTFDYKAGYSKKMTIQVKVKSISKGNPNDYGLQDDRDGPLYLTVCDKDGKPFADFANIASGYESDGLLKDMMMKKDENWILFESDFYGENKELSDETTTFIITSKEIMEPVESNSSVTYREEEKEESGDERWDEVLDDYEDYVDQYIEILEDINDGENLDAFLEFPGLMKKAKKLEENLEKANSNKDLGTDQIRRMMEIQLDMLEAVSEMEDDS